MSEFVNSHKIEQVYRLISRQTLALRIAAGLLAVTGLTGGMTWVLGVFQEGRDNIALASWTDYMRRELDSGSFSEGEQYYPRITVADGNQGVTEVNIRPFPGTILPTGKLVDVLGTIKVGGEISHVVLVNGKQPGSPLPGRWAAFRCVSATGARWDPKSKQRVEEDGICAIYSLYVGK